MIFNDIVALAKAGFSPADVREFLAASTEKTDEPLSASEPAAEETHTTQTETEPTPELEREPAEGAQNATPEPEQSNIIDYKAKYNEALEALKIAQAANTRQELPKESDSEQIFKEAMAAFM